MGEDFQYKISTLLTAAFMKEEPLVIVEGVDDVEFYKKITNKNINVKCSEVIVNSENEKYKPGCDGVIKIVEDVQTILEHDVRLEKFFLGIIDADYRNYSEETYSGYKGLFILKYYSYESHFCTDDSMKNFISAVTGARKDEITKDILEIAKNGIDEHVQELYYVGLQALEGKLNQRKTLVSYDMSAEALFEEHEGNTIVKRVMEHKNQLDEFACEYGIKKEDYRCIVRGKWLLYIIAKTVYDNISEIKRRCNEALIDQCDFCKQEIYKKCIWGKKMELRRGQLVHYFIYNNLMEPEIIYIKNKINALGV